MIRQRLQGLLFWLATQQELRWWLKRAAVQLTDEPEERFRLIRLATSMGLNGAIAFVLFSNLLMGPVQDAPIVGPLADKALPDTGININVPLSPGTTSALRICKDGIVTKGAGQVHIEGAGEMQDGYAAVLGPERLTYTDYPKGGQNLVVVLNGEAITVKPEVVECLLARGK